MKKICRWMMVPALALLIPACTTLPEPGTDDAVLSDLVRANLAASQGEDVNAVRATLHPDSPVFGGSLRTCQQLFDYYDLTFKLLSFRVLTRDDGYIIARGSQETKKITGGDFHDNVSDCLYIFRKHKDQWRLWQQTVLEAELK